MTTIYTRSAGDLANNIVTTGLPLTNTQMNTTLAGLVSGKVPDIAGYNRPSVKPALKLDFTKGKLDPRITFSRASTGTYINQFGVLSTAGINVPRFEYDPVTGKSLGLLIEESRTNLLTYSRDLTQSAWTNRTVTATHDQIGVDGSINGASKLIDTVSGSIAHLISGTSVVTLSTIYTFSAYVKSTGATWILFGQDIIGTGYFSFNVVTGSFGVYTAGTYISRSSTNVGNGWWRVSITYTAAYTTASGAIFINNMDSNNPAFVGTGLLGLNVDGAQLEIGPSATSYIPTTTAAATRTSDIALMSGININTWWNQSQGTFFAEGDQFVGAGGQASFMDLYQDGNNKLSIRTSQRLYIAASSTIGFDLSTLTQGQTHKISIAYGSQNGLGFAKDGSAITTGGLQVFSAPSPTLYIGVADANLYYLNGHIRNVTYYNIRLPDQTLQALTA